MFGDINIDKLKPRKPQISLCKPNYTTVAKLSEAYGIGHIVRLADLNEITLSVPHFVEIRKEMKKNPNIDKIRERYLIKVVLGEEMEYYIITEINDDSDDSEDTRQIKAISLGYTHRDKIIESYNEVGITAKKAMTDALSKSNWTIGANLSNDSHYFNSSVSTGGAGGRSFDISGNTVLDFIIEVAEAFNAIIVWDTVNRIIDFELPENIGTYKGLKLSYDKYLQSLSKESTTDEMVTRLTPVGSDGLTIHGANPTGSGYIEDFSFFMYPFERDEFGNTVKSSNYMTDGLCHALLDYDKLVQEHNLTFSNLLAEKTVVENRKTELENELFDLVTIQYTAQDLATAKQSVNEYHAVDFTHNKVAGEGATKRVTVSHNDDANYAIIVKFNESSTNNLNIDGFAKPKPTTGVWTLLQKKFKGSSETMIESSGSGTMDAKFLIVSITDEEYNATNNEQAILDKYNVFDINDKVNAKRVEIDAINLEIDNIDTQISDLQSILSIENNFTPEQIIERNDYIIEKIITNDSLITDEELYDFAIKEFEKLRAPQMVIDMDIVNFLEVVDSWRDWDKLKMGDIVRVQHKRIGVEVMAKIIEIEYNYEDAQIRLKIANVKDIKSDEDKLIDALYGAISTSTTVDMNKFKWDKIQQQEKDIQTLMTEEWDATKRRIVAGNNESVVISRNGIEIKNPDEPETMLVINHAVLAITKSGGNVWENAITTDGVIAERLVGKIVAGENLLIQNSSGSFRVDATGVTIEDAQFNIVSTDGSNVKLSQKFDSIDNYIEVVKTDLNGEITDVRNEITSLDTEINTTFKDGIIDSAEKLSIKQHIDQLNGQKSDLDKRYDNIYANPYLKDETGVTDKANLLSMKGSYNTAHTNLISAINTAIADSSIIDNERANVNSKFTAYNTALANLSTAFERALDNISKNKAKEAESNAVYHADAIKAELDTQILDVTTDLTDLGTYVDGAFKDGVVDDAEKKAIAEHIKSINAEKKDLDDRYTQVYNNTDLKDSTSPLVTDKASLATAKTNYNTAHTNLVNAINTAIADSAIIDNERANVESKFTAYANSLGSLAQAFDKAINNIAENKKKSAMTYADGLKQVIDQDISDVSGELTTLNGYVDGAFRDGVVEQAEAKAIASYINSLTVEKLDIDSRYSSIYNNSDMTSVALKGDLSTRKTNYDNSHASLINAINTAIADGKTSPTEKATVDSAFTDYKNKLASLSTSFETAISDIAQNKARNAETNAKSWATTEASAGKNAWSKFSGSGNTLPSGSVLFGNGQTASTIERATLNFNGRNDRNGTTPNAPVVGATVSGTVVDAIDHTINTDGSVDISFEWDFNTGSGNASDIDGFIVYVFQGTSSGAYSFGTSPDTETVYYMTPEKRAIILYGVPADKYYTFGVQAYRIVDKDVNSTGVIKSSIIKDTKAGHNPYRPSLSVAFNGAITGTIVDSTGASKNASEVADKALGSLQQGTAYNNVTVDSNAGLVATRSDNLVRTLLNATSGIAIQKYENGNWVNKLYADANGNLFLTGNITMTGGTITWANVTKPTYTATEVGARPSTWMPTASDVGAKPSSYTAWQDIGVNRLTAITQDGVYTGTLVADQIKTGVIQANRVDLSTSDNLIWNSEYVFGTGGGEGWGQGNSVVGDPAHTSSNGKVTSQSSRDGHFGGEFAVTEYEQFNCGAWAFGGYSTKTFGVGIRFTMKDGSFSWLIACQWSGGQAWEFKQGTVTAPHGAVSGRAFFQISAFDTFGTWLYDKTFIKRSSLITFDNARGGTLTLGGSGNGNGSMSVLDASGNQVIRMNNNGIELNNGAKLVGNGGVISSFSFVSGGEYGNWTRVGAVPDGGQSYGQRGFLNFDIPSGFTITNATMKVFIAPHVNHTTSDGVNWSTEYRQLKNVRIWRGTDMSGFQLHTYFEPWFTHAGYGFTDITNNVWGGAWNPTANQYTQAKGFDVTSYVSVGENIFMCGSNNGVNDAGHGAMCITLTVKGYQN